MDRGDDIFAPESLAALDAALEEVARELDEDDGPVDRDVATRRDRHPVGTQTLQGGSPAPSMRAAREAADSGRVDSKTTLVVGGKNLAAEADVPPPSPEAPALAEPVREPSRDPPSRDPLPPTTKNERGLGRRPEPHTPVESGEASPKKKTKKRRRPKSEPPPAQPSDGDASSRGAHADETPDEPAPPTRESAKPPETAPPVQSERPAKTRPTRNEERTQPSPAVLPIDEPAPWRTASTSPPRPSASPAPTPSSFGLVHVVGGLVVALGIGFIAGRGSAPESDVGPQATVSAAKPPPPPSPPPRPTALDPEPPAPPPAPTPVPDTEVDPGSETPEIDAPKDRPKGVWPSPTGDGDPFVPPPRPEPVPQPPAVPPPPAPAKPTPKGPDKSFVPEDI